MNPTRRERRRQRRRQQLALGVVAGLAIVAIAVGAASRFGDGDGDKVAAPAPTSPTTTSTSRPTTTTTLPHEPTLIATANVAEIDVFDTPEATEPSKTFDNPWFVNDDPALPVPLVFSVQEQRDDGWLEVLLPTRPNGSTGWVRQDDVVLSTTDYRITIELGAHRLRVFELDDLVLEDKVAVGAPATPTPTGNYYVVALLQAPNPNTVYGPYAYGLSGHSDVLETFAGGDAEIGIHGNNDPLVLGTDVTHGCVRMSNDAITQLAALLPLGTPVTISS